MAAGYNKGTTAVLAEWAAGFRLADAPVAVVDRMKALVLDLLRVVTVGAPLPWSRSVRCLAPGMDGTGNSSILLTGERLDAGRAAFVNGAYAHPRGSPHRRMTWDELSALFKDTVAEALPAPALDRVLDLVAGLDRDTHPRDITAAFIAVPGWLDRGV